MNNEQSENKKSTNSRNKGGYRVRSLTFKKQAVEEYLQGETPLRDILKKYDVKAASLYNWIRQVERGNDLLIKAKRYPESMKLHVVREINSGAISKKEALGKYKIAKASTIEDWCSKYSIEIGAEISNLMRKENKEQSGQQDDRITQLQKALQEANLKILGLETMINIAEKELKVDIRKKSGTKQ